MSIEDILVIITFSGLIYTIVNNSPPFAKRKIIFDIFDELGRLKDLKKIVLDKTTYAIIYIIGGMFVMPYLHSIIDIISILFWIIIVSLFIIMILAVFQKYYKDKLKFKIINYKVSSIMSHVYILLFILILSSSIEDLPHIAFLSISSFFFYWNPYLIKIIIFLYIVGISDTFLLKFAIVDKYDTITNKLKRLKEKLWVTVLLKNGEKISGDLQKIDPKFLKLQDFEKTTYKIKYRQIEIIGCRYYTVEPEPVIK